MDNYDNLKRKNLRGSKIRKIRKLIRNYRKALEADSVKEDISQVFQSDNNEGITRYAQIISLKTIQNYIDVIFAMDKYKENKREFNQKVFSGAKVVTVIEFIDFQIQELFWRYSNLENNFNYFGPQYNEVFSILWKEQMKIYKKAKRWILIGFNTTKGDEGFDSDIDLLQLLSDYNDDD
jgi:hypothetical protein